MKTCKECGFWKENDAEIIRIYNRKEGFGDCKSDKFVYTDGGNTEKDGLGYWDGEGCWADFETGEDFGCIHFKEIG